MIPGRKQRSKTKPGYCCAFITRNDWLSVFNAKKCPFNSVAFKRYAIEKIAVLLLTLFPFLSQAQEYPRPEINPDQLIQNLFGQPEEDVNYEDLYESLFQLYAHPLDLNTATRDELAALHLLSEAQLNAFYKHRNENGKLLSIYELQSIAGFDLAAIHKILPFVEVQLPKADGRPLWQRMLTTSSQSLIVRYDRVLEAKKGYSTAIVSGNGTSGQRYWGNPDRMYTRYRMNHSHDFSLGFTLEKDAGEQIRWQPATHRYGTDFLSFHGFIENQGRWKRIAVGDYQIQTGQGLLLGAGFAMGKGAETVTSVRRNETGIRPYTSAMETGFFRGVAGTYSVGKMDITGFYSRSRRDGNLTNLADSLSDAASDSSTQSIYSTGYHRTRNEINTKGQLGEQVLGTNILFRHQNLHIGSTFLHTQYRVPIQRKPADYNQFEFNGRENWSASLHYSYLWQNMNLVGEAALSRSGGAGMIYGLIASLTAKIELSLLYRRYDRHFHSFYGNAFGENTRNSNEHGMYWGIKILPVRKIVISAYYDQFRFPWLKYRVDAPSQGYEYLLRLSWQPVKTILLYGQLREEHKELNPTDAFSAIRRPEPLVRKYWLLNLDYNAAKLLSLQTRVQGSTYRHGTTLFTTGYALVQDISTQFGKLKLSSRFALFDTDDYNNRQYVYEKDVLNSFSLPAYYQRGERHYLLLQYPVSRHLDVWLRFARTSLRDQATIGSGLEEINAPHKTEVKAQMRLKF